VSGEAVTDIGRDRALARLEQMVLVRRFEERCAIEYQATRIRGFLHLYIGEEAVAVGCLAALEPRDSVIATYREHGHALVRGLSPESVMAEMFGKAGGCSRGRGGSMHLFSAAHRFFGGHAIVGGGLPVAAGLALADRLRGTGAVTMAFFGEGAVVEGEFHEAMNLAALWGLPVVFVCENNGYAMGTALLRSQAQPEPWRRAAGYGIDAEAVDGMDVVAVEAAAARIVARVRDGGGPYLLEARTYRFRAHSMFDPELYRDKAEVAEWRQRCPIATFVSRMEAAGVLGAADLAAIEARVAARIEAAVAFAAASPWEPEADLTRDVMSPAPEAS
jgi:pyruvate dehydrogenase E1 component alpha subunit